MAEDINITIEEVSSDINITMQCAAPTEWGMLSGNISNQEDLIHLIPTNTSDLTNDSDFVCDADYVHTDNNFTDALLTKVNNQSGVNTGDQIIPTATSDLTNDSGFITSADVPTALSELTDDSAHRLVTDTEKSTWNGKQDAGDYATNTALDLKVDKVAGKGLSTNDLTDEIKASYDGAVDLEHSHNNKTLLDSYSQTEVNLADAVSKKHTQNTDNTLLSPDKTKTVIYTDNSGACHIDGDIIQNGSTYQMEVQQISTSEQEIILRNNATVGMVSGDYTGLKANLYDGLHTGRLGFDKDGVAVVGDIGDEQALATRENTPIDGGLAIWNASTFKFETLLASIKTGYDNAVTWISTNGSNILSHIANTLNPHNVTATQIGLSNVDNTSDINKPVSTAQQTALNLKANDSSVVHLAGTATNTGAKTFSRNITNNANEILTATTFASQNGIIYKNTDPFIHNFNYGNNGTVTTDGFNTIVGIGAGNLTMGSTATSASHSSRNTFIEYNSGHNNTTGYYNSAQGAGALQNNTTGNSNSAQGAGALQNNTTGFSNSAQGAGALQNNTTGNSNSAQGVNALRYNTTGNYNSAQGVSALQNNTTGNSNSAQGVNALQNNTTGYYNSAQGAGAGRYIANGVTGRTTGNNGIYLGYNSKASDNETDNEIVIGANAIGKGLNIVVLGNTSTTATYLAGKLNIGTVSEYADNTAALAGGLGVGDVYRTDDLLKVVH